MLVFVLHVLTAIHAGGSVAAAPAPPSARVTCAGPIAAEADFFAHAEELGEAAEHAVHDRSRLGCVPLGPDGQKRRGLVQAALRQQRAIGQATDAAAALSPTVPAWASVGPSPIATGASAASGRLLSMAYDAALSGGTLFIGAAGGGVWSSTSPFTSWTTHTDGLPNLAISALAVDPTNASTIYAGTGEQSSSYDALYGEGVFKSTDGGASWTAAGSPAGGWGFGRVSRIVVSPAGAVYAATGSAFGGGAIEISTDGGATWNAGQGIASAGDSVSDLAVDSVGNVTAAVGTALAPQTDNGIYECASPCGSSSAWTLIGGGAAGTHGFPASSAVNSIKISVVHSTLNGGGNAAYAVASDSAASGSMLGVYRLLPSTTTWTQIATVSIADVHEGQAWYDMYIWANPADTTGGTVYVGLTDIYKSVNAAGVTPTWTNLTSVYSGGSTGVHPDQQAITSNGASTIFFGNDGGAWSSTDGGSTFANKNGNLTTLEFYGGDAGTKASEGCAAHCDPTARIGGMQDNGTAQTTGGAAAWTRDAGFGDGGFALIDPHDNNNRYGENAFGGIVSTTDGFATHKNATTGGACGNSNFYAPMALDPGTPTTLLVGMRDLCETTNATGTPPVWTDISKIGGNSVTSDAISAIAVSDAGGTKIYVGDDTGHTYFTTNNGTSWTPMDLGAPGGPLHAILTATVAGPSSSWGFGLQITGLAADLVNSGVVYATVNGFQGSSAGHVFKWVSTGGPNGTWSDISGNLPDEPYDAVVVNPVRPAQIFVGGITGVFGTTNGGAGWNAMGTGLPNVQVDGLKVSADGSTLIAFTHGRSAWELAVGLNRGDVNGDGTVDIADVFYLINGLFASGAPPVTACAGDANFDTSVNVADVFFLINFLFAGGPTPAAC